MSTFHQLLNLSKMLHMSLHNFGFESGFGGFLLGMLLVGWVVRPGSLLYKETQSAIIFRRRLSSRIGGVITGLSILILSYFSTLEPAWRGIRDHSQSTWSGIPAAALTMGYGLMSWGLFYGSGLADLLFDLDKRTYTLTTGWLWSPKVTSASFRNIKSIILKQPGGNLGGCSARMIWRDSQNRITFLLGRFPDEEQAAKLARDLSQALDFSRED